MLTAITDRHPALLYSDFRHVFWNAFFASASFWTMLLARGWLVFELTGQGAWVGAVTFAGMIQMTIFGPIGGALADRADRRMMAIVADAVGIFAAVALAAITFAGLVEAWHVLVFAVIGGLGRAFGTPAEQAIIPNVVPSEHLLNAVALSGITRHGSRIAGPLIGGALLTTIGAGAVFVLSGAFLTLAVIELVRLEYRSPPRPRGAESAFAVAGVYRDIIEGVRYVERDPRVLIMLVLVGFHCGATMAFDSMMPTLATIVGGADVTYSGIIIGIGVGSIIGTLIVSMLQSDAAMGRMFFVIGIGSGFAMFVVGFASTPFLAVTGGVFAGATQASYMAMSATFVQRITPDEFRGRVMALYVVLAAGHMAFVNFGFGWLSDETGVRVLLLIPAIAWIAGFTAATMFLPEVRSLVTTGNFRERPAPVAVASDRTA
ncbi:MAG: MFS transporter [Chloroflexi bacterium]|nr:MFS transporter [Chloroflexota bacterium]